MTTSEVCAFCDGQMDARFILSIDGVALCEWCRELPADVLGEYPDAALTFTIEAFYAVGLRLEDGPLAAQLNELLGFPGSPRPYMPRDGAHALQLAGLPAVDGAQILAWEWMYG